MAGTTQDLAHLVGEHERELPHVLSRVAQLVEVESPSEDLPALAAAAEVVTAVGTEIMARKPNRLETEGVPHLLWRWGKGPIRLLLLGHYDTVWPVGTLERTPFEVSSGVMTGPGCFDMKAGIVMAMHAVAGVARDGFDLAGVAVLLTGDEEVGSPGSRELIEDAAREAHAVLVLEPAAEGGALKSARKGVAMYRVGARGRSAHAGLEPERGRSALLELAAQAQAIAGFGDAGFGTTVSPTRIRCGDSANTVPGTGWLDVDVRVLHPAELQRVDDALRNLRPATPGVSIQVERGPVRPPFPEDASRDLLRRARRAASRLGLPAVADRMVGGGSDGNFTAALGVPTLDGLGAVGGGAHAPGEHVLIDELAPRTAMIRAMLGDLLGAPLEGTSCARGPEHLSGSTMRRRQP